MYRTDASTAECQGHKYETCLPNGGFQDALRSRPRNGGGLVRGEDEPGGPCMAIDFRFQNLRLYEWLKVMNGGDYLLSW